MVPDTFVARDSSDAVTRDRVCDVTRMSGKIIGEISKIMAYDGRVNMKAWTIVIACNNNCCLVRKESQG